MRGYLAEFVGPVVADDLQALAGVLDLAVDVDPAGGRAGPSAVDPLDGVQIVEFEQGVEVFQGARPVEVKRLYFMCAISRRIEGRIASRKVSGEIMQMKSQEMVYQGAMARAGVQVVQGWPAAAIRP